MPSACSTASRRAGCRAKPAASSAVCSGSSASTNRSSPARHSERRPWNAGPYTIPVSARRAYSPSTSTGSAPSGGQIRGSQSATSDRAAPRVPVACRVHGSSSGAPSGRAWIRTVRIPWASAGSTDVCTCTAPSCASTSGARRVSSSTP